MVSEKKRKERKEETLPTFFKLLSLSHHLSQAIVSPYFDWLLLDRDVTEKAKGGCLVRTHCGVKMFYFHTFCTETAHTFKVIFRW
jgi:hypothetical protein